MAEDLQEPTVIELIHEVDRLHTWDGLMSVLDEHYPAEVFDGSSGDPGARIVVLVRALAAVRAENAWLQALLDSTFALQEVLFSLRDPEWARRQFVVGEGSDG